MNINVEPGKYVVAVSGGVDSVALLDLVARQKKLEAVVAHFDHGIRDDSAEDRRIVQALAKKHGLQFEYAHGRLGKNTSEEAARTARYKFLQKVKAQYHAKAIVTAHHQDDVLETMCINILRGTKRRGLSSLQSTDNIKRLLLNYSKQEIIEYAQKNNLTWREDSTNNDERYLRNWIRKNVIAKLSEAQRKQLLNTQSNVAKLNSSLDKALDKFLQEQALSKKTLVSVDHVIGMEIVAHWLRKNNLADFDKKTLERIVVGAKTLAPNKQIPIYGGNMVVIVDEQLKIIKKS